MESSEKLIAAAIQQHQAGDFASAEHIYDQVLQSDPDNVDALHLKGVVAHQTGRSADAIPYILRAVQLNPQAPTIHSNLSSAYQVIGDLERAEKHCRQAIQLKPDYGDAYSNLGVILKRRGKIAEAVAAYQTALQANPNRAETHHNLAVALRELGQLEASVSSDERALQLKPRYTNAHLSLALTWQQLGQLDRALACYESAEQLKTNSAEIVRSKGLALQNHGRLEAAIECYRRALSISPDNAETHNLLGTVYHEQQTHDEAISEYRRAIELKPSFPEAHNNLANSLLACGRHEEAIQTYQAAIEIRPQFVEAFANLGLALKARGKTKQAIEAFERALQIDPNRANTHNDLGVVLQADGRLQDALASYKLALQLDPQSAEAYTNLGTCWEQLKDFDQALTSYRRAIDLRGEFCLAHTHLLHLQQQMCEWRDMEETAEAVIAASENGQRISPGILLTLPTTAADQFRCGRQWAAEFTRGTVAADVAEEKSLLTVGYLSADFREHPVANLAVELFEQHDRAHFKAIAYSFGHNDGSDLRRRLETAFDEFVDVKDMDFEGIARRIKTDGVDILVDLMGYTKGARTEVLALRPAPLQVNYLGYPATMGTEFIDYIVVDDFVVPDNQQPHFAEKLIHLSGSYLVNGSSRPNTDRQPSRDECGLPGNGFVFCCFNQSYKITPAAFQVWMNVLASVPESVLWLQATNRFAVERLQQHAESSGVSPDRLIFAKKVPEMADHLARIRLADLFLDTWPYNAHTTASDALWVGCPVVTFAGQTFVSRVAGSLLQTLGMDELITSSPQEYERLAVQLAGDPDRLLSIQERLAEARDSSGLFDGKQFARKIEAAYQQMWEQTCRRASGNT